jgi:hypothetical protein
MLTHIQSYSDSYKRKLTAAFNIGYGLTLLHPLIVTNSKSRKLETKFIRYVQKYFGIDKRQSNRYKQLYALYKGHEKFMSCRTSIQTVIALGKRIVSLCTSDSNWQDFYKSI